MLIRYQGTGAYEGIPALFCPCETCRAARAAGGPEVRTRSGALIDGVVKLDFPPDSYFQMLRDGLDFTKLTCALITHTHTDHYAVWDLMTRLPKYANLEGAPPLIVAGSERCGELLFAELQKKHEPDGAGRIEFVRAKPREPLSLAGYVVTAVRANHKPSEEALNYVVEGGGRRMLYAHDTGDHHMGLPNCRRVREKLVQTGAARPGAVFALSHISHNSHVSHERLLRAADGFTVACDGMEIQI